MKFTTAILVLLTATAHTAPTESSSGSLMKRNCYGSGQEYGSNYNKAYSNARIACKILSNVSYRPGEDKQICFNLDSGTKVEFQIRNDAGHDQTMNQNLCLEYLPREVHGCPKGGRSSHGSWFYK